MSAPVVQIRGVLGPEDSQGLGGEGVDEEEDGEGLTRRRAHAERLLGERREEDPGLLPNGSLPEVGIESSVLAEVGHPGLDTLAEAFVPAVGGGRVAALGYESLPTEKK